MSNETGHEAVAIVVGRMNSMGLPQKNTRDFLGRPLVEWSILQAAQSKLVSKVIVSSDDPHILELANNQAVETVIRPPEMGADESPIAPALLHAIESRIPDANSRLTVVLLEPTSPLRPKGFIDRALETYWASGACSAVSVGKSGSQHPSFSVKMSQQGFISQYEGGQLGHLRRQDTSEVYFLEGSFYATSLESLRKSGEIYSGTILGIPVKKWQEIEIDDIDDFTMAESLGALHSHEL